MHSINTEETQDQADKLELDRIRRETKRVIKRSKKNLEEYIADASKLNPKEFYQYVKNKKNSKLWHRPSCERMWKSHKQRKGNGHNLK